MSESDPSLSSNRAREKFLGLSLESTRKSYYPQLQAQLSALRENERRMRLLADNLPARISYVDADQRFQFVNREYARALELDRNAIIGRHLWDILGRRSYGKIVSQVEAALSGNQTCFEVMFDKRDATPVWLEVNYVPHVDADGRVCGFYDLSHDLTERKRAEAALRESEAKNRELVQHAPAGIFEIDLETMRFTRVNEVMCTYTGFSMDEFLSLDPYSLLCEESKTALDRMLQAVAAGSRHPEPTEFSARVKDDRVIRVLVNTRFFFEGDQPRRAMAVAHDVTAAREAEQAKKQLEIKLQEAQKLESLGTLAGGIAHDFNNLLMGIQGNASLSLLDLGPDSPHFQHLKNIETYVRRGVDLTRQLLGLARGGKYEVKPTDLNALLNSSADMFGRTRKELRIHLKCAADLWPVNVDRGQIEQVLLNLFINAWHAMPDGGDMFLETCNVVLDETDAAAHAIAPGRYVRAAVTDTGVGIDPAIRQKLFDPFFTTKGVGKGSGLGLASAYGIIQNHHGVIDVESEPGRGSVFFFYLPASTAEAGQQSDSSVPEQPASGTETILLVDDESMILEVGQRLLTRLGYTVITADSGQAAVEILVESRDRIDLVILDMIMPGMGGSDAFDHMKRIDPAVNVLLSSGYSIDGQAERILKRGCRGFIQKPFSIGELAQKVRAVLD
jgi:two-component system cell cycle sensor histidine kinase/response regulator CckA